MKNILSVLFLAIFCQFSVAQNVAIGTGTPTPDASAVLDLQSTDKGLLVPRVANPASIGSPATGLMVYNTTTNKFNYYNGATWIEIGNGSGTVTSVSGTAPIVSSGGNTPAISISGATPSAAGSMSSTDKAKLDAITGTNTGDQTITLTGDVTGSGTGSFATSIGIGKVTNAMLAGGIDLSSKVSGILPIANGGTGSATQNWVDLTTSQSIAGAKTWTTAAVFSASGVALSVTNSIAAGGDISATGVVYWGNALVRTETRDNAGLQGNAGARSGFFETANPTNYPATTGNAVGPWYHLIEARHSNNTNNYALQITGSFFDQRFFMRKTDNSPTTAWSEVITSSNIGSQSVNSATNATNASYATSCGCRGSAVVTMAGTDATITHNCNTLSPNIICINGDVNNSTKYVLGVRTNDANSFIVKLNTSHTGAFRFNYIIIP